MKTLKLVSEHGPLTTLKSSSDAPLPIAIRWGDSDEGIEFAAAREAEAIYGEFHCGYDNLTALCEFYGLDESLVRQAHATQVAQDAQKNLVQSLLKSIEDLLCSRIDDGLVPSTWDGVELRWLLTSMLASGEVETRKQEPERFSRFVDAALLYLKRLR